MTSYASEETSKKTSKKEKKEKSTKKEKKKTQSKDQSAKKSIKKPEIPAPRVQTLLKKHLKTDEFQFPQTTAVFLAGAATCLNRETAKNLAVTITQNKISQVNSEMLKQHLLFVQ